MIYFGFLIDVNDLVYFMVCVEVFEMVEMVMNYWEIDGWRNGCWVRYLVVVVSGGVVVDICLIVICSVIELDSYGFVSVEVN